MDNLVKSIKKLNNKNKIIFSSLPFPPKLCNKEIQNHEVIFEKKIKIINTLINQFNFKKTGLSLNLSKYGGTPFLPKLHKWKEIEIKISYIFHLM